MAQYVLDVRAQLPTSVIGHSLCTRFKYEAKWLAAFDHIHQCDRSPEAIPRSFTIKVVSLRHLGFVTPHKSSQSGRKSCKVHLPVGIVASCEAVSSVPCYVGAYS
jgi:hypothetical protein